MSELREQERNDEQLFMEEMSKLLYPQSHSKIKKDCFEVLYNKENEGKSTGEFMNLLNQKERLNCTIHSDTRVTQLRTDVAKKIKQSFEPEMRADIGERVDLIPGKKGRSEKGNAPHEVASHWLWDYKYPRWVVDRGLQSLIVGADKRSDWIDFKAIDSHCALTGNRRPLPVQPTIELNTPSFMSIKLPNPWGYFLLLNRGFVQRLFLCPSLDVAPTNQVDGEEMLMPQKDAGLENIFFNEIGKEEFIGIWVEKQLNLPWVQSESLPSCTPERINHLLSELSGSQCQVFYKSFDVVEI
ncbi:MAG: hypothetical protein AB4426_34645 [Xenococcaceae cyanobacterium]